MKALFIAWMIAGILLCGSCASAEADVQIDLNPVYEFADGYGAKAQAEKIYEAALTGDGDILEGIADWLKEAAREPVSDAVEMLYGLLPAVLLSALLSGMLPEDRGSSGAARFLLRLTLLLGFCEPVISALECVQSCVSAGMELTDRITPLMSALLVAAGMEGSAALLSPMAMLVGNIAEKLFLNYGLPLCRAALCTAIAGNLSEQFSLKRFTGLLMRLVNWGSGAVVTVFTAYLALQGSVASGLDGVLTRTAKYAVDSASPILGGGISEAWESYLAGLRVTGNALGISGVAALILAGARPIFACLGAMLGLHLVSALLDTFGAKASAEAAEQIAGVCRLALSLCTATLVIVMILLGTILQTGRSLVM